MTLAEAVQAAGRGLQREFDLDALTRTTQARFADLFAAQSAMVLDLFERFRDDFPVSEAEGVPEPPWESVWSVIADETSGEIESIVSASLPPALESGALATIADLGIAASFSLENPLATAYLEQRGAELVTQINETTRGRLRTIMTNGARKGTAYSKIATQIVDQFADMGGLKPQAHIRNRAELIAVTELGNAYEEAGSIVSRDFTRGGVPIEKFWSTIGDNRVTPLCIGNAAVGWIPESASFPSGHTRPLRFPGCRCATIRRAI